MHEEGSRAISLGLHGFDHGCGTLLCNDLHRKKHELLLVAEVQDLWAHAQVRPEYLLISRPYKR